MNSDALTMIPGVPFPEYYEFFMSWKAPIALATTYAVSVHLLNPSASKAKVSRVEAKNQGAGTASKSSPLMTAFVFLHNLSLAIYSMLTFFNMVQYMHKLYNRGNSIHDAYCDKDGFLWDNALGYWGYIFYLSKYYEVIDTIIILLKGRRSSLLQTYHHAGAMITMWAGIRYRAQPIWIFVVFNSLVHSIMYLYYAMTSVGIHVPGKRYITSIQISQFLVGMTAATSYLFLNDCLVTPGQKFAVLLNVLYLLPLTYLFLDFARRTYGKRRAAAAAAAGAKKVN